MIAHLMLAIGESMTLSLLVKATLMLACTHLAVAAATGVSAAMRHVMLSAGFAALLLLPIASTTLPIVPIGMTVAGPVSNNVSTRVIEPRATGAPGAESVRAPASPPQDLQSRPWLSLAVLAASVWVVGIVLTLSPVLLGFLSGRRVRRHSLPWHPPVCVREIVRGSGLRRVIAFRRHPDVHGPMTFGVFRPVIVCPIHVATWSDEDLARAMTHEVEHVRRCDWLTLTLARLVSVGLWFHPLAWTAWRRMRLEAERACDDAVLRDADPTAYAEQLVSLARGMTPWLPFLAMACRYDLSARIRAILDSQRPRSRAGAGRVAGVVLATIPMVALIGAVRGVAIAQSDVPTLRPEFSVVRLGAPNQQREYSTSRTEHFTLIFPADLNANVTAIGEEAERAYRQIAADLGHDLSRSVPIGWADDPSFISSEFLASRDTGGDRILLPTNRPELVSGLLRHELTHVFAFAVLPPTANGGVVPGWIYEGLAEHERGGWATSDENMVRDAIRTDTVPRLTLGEPVSARDPRFVIAHAFFDFLQSEYGKVGIRQLLAALDRPGRDVYADAFGVDAEAVDRQFQRYVRLRFER